MSRILVVDDNALSVEGTAALLRATGHDVVVAGTAAAALKELFAAAFDVLLTDLDLPGISGWELAAQAQKLRPAIRILVMTGWTIDPNEPAPVAGIERIFLKPVDAAELLAAL